MSYSVILLAGGTGTRMGAAIPKQFLELGGKPIALHSFELFCSMAEISEVVVVCAPDYRHLFSTDKILTFADPGIRRQDSVAHGFSAISSESPLVCIHDTARPFVTEAMVRETINAAKNTGASAVGVPIKSTVKRCSSSGIVLETPDRSSLWEVQTPQVLQVPVLHEGLAYANKHNITVTDDVSLAELVGHPVQIVQGSYNNIKITTPEDLLFANHELTTTL